MDEALRDKKIVIVGGGSGIGRRIARDALDRGASVVLADRDQARLEQSAAELIGEVDTARLDLDDEGSVIALAEQVGELDHLVSLAANHANGPVTELRRDAIVRAFDAKVIGVLLLAKHLAGRFRDGGSMLLFSGIAAWKPEPGLVVMATTNGAVSFLAGALAVELAPLRVNALSPGIVDSGAWDHLGAEKEKMFADVAARIPARRIGRPADISAAALVALADPFMTGATVHVDGGGRLV
ncbi:SDR family oxidoreductase [Pseudonocardia acidicola]|uniref:SDR family oxidoreductase n=1 Tax=Pseudonocardia acidicola TaxID=2724939 RepID=UPI0030843EFB